MGGSTCGVVELEDTSTSIRHKPNMHHYKVARELEDPYTADLGSSANRLQVAAMHSDFNERLLIFHRNGRGPGAFQGPAAAIDGRIGRALT